MKYGQFCYSDIQHLYQERSVESRHRCMPYRIVLCMQGTPGVSGRPGTDGKPGLPGRQGLTGLQGQRGEKGPAVSALYCVVCVCMEGGAWLRQIMLSWEVQNSLSRDFYRAILDLLARMVTMVTLVNRDHKEILGHQVPLVTQ